MKAICIVLISLAATGLTVLAKDKSEGEEVKKPAIDKAAVKKPDGEKKPGEKKPDVGNKVTVKKPNLDQKPAAKKPDASGKVIKKPTADKKPGARTAGSEFAEIRNRCDEDKNGTISLDEFKTHQPAGKDPASVVTWFHEHDKDSDGQLSKSDFAPPPTKK